MRLLRYLRSGDYDRRRTLLGLVGAIWALYGWAIFTSPKPGSSFGRLFPPLDLVLNSRWSGLLWVGCGILAGTAALWPRACGELAGFNALLIPPLLWVTLGVWSWSAYLISDGLVGGPRAWVTTLVFLPAVVGVLVAAGWPEDPGPPRRKGDRSWSPPSS